MRTTGISTKLIRLLSMLGLVAVIAASCSSDTTTSAADDTGADEQSSVTTAAPEIEATATEAVVEDETLPAPDAAVIAMTEAWGSGDSDAAWSYESVRCQRSTEMPGSFSNKVASYGAIVPGATALEINAIVDGNTAQIGYDVHDGSGEFEATYRGQPWIFEDGGWFKDQC